MKYFVTLNGRTREVSIDGNRVTLDGKAHQAELHAVAGTPIRLLVLDGVTWPLPMEGPGRGAWTVLAQGERLEVEVVDERMAHLRSLVGQGRAHAGPQALKAPMPGMVVRVLAQPGQKVVEGTSLIVLEAMKMENELKAAAQGTVEQVLAVQGRSVEKGEVLITFQSI